VDTRLSRIRK